MVLLNLDAGELPDEDAELWWLFDVVNVACGGHAGDAASMARVVGACVGRERPVVGAHPSYPDRAGFGRRSQVVDPDDLAELVREQCARLAVIAHARGVRVAYVKPHGALYHDASQDDARALAIVRGAAAGCGDVAVIGPPGGALRRAADTLGFRYLREGFADRALRADGSLVPRSEPGALITDAAAAVAQARALAANVDTLCLHADTPGVRAIARAVRDACHAG